MAERIDLNPMLARLGSLDARSRDLAAAELTDLIQANYLMKAELKRVAKRLLQSAGAEKDPSAKESAFNGLSEASMVGGSEPAVAAAVAKLLDDLPTDCLEHGLVILGFSGEPKYKSQLRAFLTHEDEDIRETARASLAQIEHEEKKAMRHAPRVRRRA
jgi:hypothetical protein